MFLVLPFDHNNTIGVPGAIFCQAALHMLSIKVLYNRYRYLIHAFMLYIFSVNSNIFDHGLLLDSL